MKIGGVVVDNPSIQRWVYKFTPFIELEMKRIKIKVWASWRLYEIYIKVKVIWCYLYRAVDKLGNTVDFLLTRKRKRMSVQSFLIKAIRNNCRPRIINIDKSGSNIAAIKVYNTHSFSKIKILQCKYLNNIVEQYHRFIKCAYKMD